MLSRVLILLFGAATWLAAQNNKALIFSVGDAIPGTNGQNYHYLLWQPGDAGATVGKRFAVYAKDGGPESPASFARVSLQAPLTSPAATFAALKLAAPIDADAALLIERIHALHAENASSPFDPGTLPTELDLDTATKLTAIIASAKDDGELVQSLMSLGRTHPGVMMALGHGYICNVGKGSLTTYEIREVDAGGSDLRVIGRVTINSDSPHEVAQPGRPIAVPHPAPDPVTQVVASAKDHLNARLRWGLDEDFRRQMPYTHGFNIYRLPEKLAEAAPSLDTVADVLAIDANARISSLPVAATDLLDPAVIYDAEARPEVIYFADDKSPPADRFLNGERYYYFVAARNIAGHPGPLSPGTLVTMTDRVPPSNGAVYAVENVFSATGAEAAAGTGAQHLRVVIDQALGETAENTPAGYRVYRWQKPDDWVTHGGNPEFNFIGTVPHDGTTRFVTFADDGAPAEDPDGLGPVTTPAGFRPGEGDDIFGKTYWYTVRAFDDAAVAPANLSGHSGANYGVLRDRVGPANPTGTIRNCTFEPRIFIEQKPRIQRAQYGLTPAEPGFAVRLTREIPDQGTPFPRVARMELQIGVEKGNTFDVAESRVARFRGVELFRDIIIPRSYDSETTVRARTVLHDGSASDWLVSKVENGNLAPEEIQRLDFEGTHFSRYEDAEPGPTGEPPVHETVDENGNTTPVSGTVQPTPNTWEVRVYRRVDEFGPLELIARTNVENAAEALNWQERSVVAANGVTVCYFAQLFDRNGNSSSLIRLGCVTTQAANLATPMLTVEPLDDGKARLTWFCDPVGVDRFLVYASVDGSTEDPEITSPDLYPSSEALLDEDLIGTTGNLLFLRGYPTPGLDGPFGANGGEFSVDVSVPVGRPLFFMVQAVGRSIETTSGTRRTEGPFSNLVAFSWRQPSKRDEPVIPFPARPLPPSYEVSGRARDFTFGTGPLWAQPLPPESMNAVGASASILVGIYPDFNSGNAALPNHAGLFPDDRDPESWLFHMPDQFLSPSETSLLPIVVYRHQLPSTRFPNAKPNLIQVTPLIEQIAHKPTDGRVFEATDKFFVFQPFNRNGNDLFRVPYAGPVSREGIDDPALTLGPLPEAYDETLHPAYLYPTIDDSKKDWDPAAIFLRDLMPATRGAKYRYLIVRFTRRGEIDRVIPTNPIQH